MKRVLVTGLNSYIGNSFERYVKEMPGGVIETKKVSLKEDGWQKISWKEYDTVLHVAGLAHVDVAHANEEVKRRYYQINRDLAEEAARKARADGVKQFIYLSSIIVYGDSAPIGREKRITKETKAMPANFYGDSKLQGEQAVLKLQSKDSSKIFHVLVLRLPMIYGRGSRGNFSKLKKLAGKTPIFPEIQNRRSMLYIENLCELIRISVEKELRGIIYPQNKEMVSTSELVRLLGEQRHRKVMLISGLSPILKLCAHFTGYINKIFGNLEYDEGLSKWEMGYCRYSLKESLIDMERQISDERTID